MSEQTEQLRGQAAGGTFCIISYNHPDFAWCHTRDWHEERYAVSTGEALDLMAAHPEFRFCMEPWIDHVIPFLERCPDRVEELRARLNSGQMGVQAFTLTSPRPATCPDETFLRNMILGRRQYRAFAPQADLSVMACPDVGIGHSQMPQVCKLAGASMYRGWRSDTAFNYRQVPRHFRWRGLDGTELITSRGCYGGLLSDYPQPLADHWEAVVEQLFAADLGTALGHAPNRTWFVPQGMDDARPLRSFDGDRLLPLLELSRLWNEREASRLIFATPNEFAALLAQDSLPLWDGVIDEVDVAYNSGWHGQPGLWRLRQDLDTALMVGERAFALATLRGAAAPSLERQQELWWETIRIASHALQWIFERDWDWLTSRARYLLREIRDETRRTICSLAGVGRQWRDERPLILFNPLPYAREEIIEVPWVEPRQEAQGVVLRDAAGQTVPLQQGEPVAPWAWRNVDWEAPLIFKARVPALGWAVYRAAEAEPTARPAPPPGDLVDNGRLRIKTSGRGLQEVTDLATGLCWKAPLGTAIGDCKLHEMGPGVLHVGPITGELSGRIGTGSWIASGPLRWIYRWETEFHGHRVRQDVILDDGARHLDFLTRVYCAGANGFFGLVFDLPFAGNLEVDIPFGLESRNPDEQVYAHNLPEGYQNIERHRDKQFWARSLASFSDGTQGLSLITADGDKYWTYDAATRRLRHILFTPLTDDKPGWEQWVTKSRCALGWHEFRHRLVFHDGDGRQADLPGLSDRLRLPLLPIKPLGPAHAPGGDSGDQLALSPRSVRLSAFYSDPAGTVVRVYESAGAAARATFALPQDFSAATKTDFNLEPLAGEVRLTGRTLELDLRPWEIATVLLT